ncbi:hypothetical protein XENOCAPTIV_017549, partial [Xenoophorus captivus]
WPNCVISPHKHVKTWIYSATTEGLYERINLQCTQTRARNCTIGSNLCLHSSASNWFTQLGGSPASSFREELFFSGPTSYIMLISIMGKALKRKNLADKVRKTKAATEIKNNPFEVKINRKKFDVLGRKAKHDVGLPGVSRSKAINKRVHEKRDVYNLNEEEELTHYGQSLAEMEKFNDTVGSDDESEEKGLLSGGGGLLRKKTSGEDQHDEQDSQKTKSRQELIEELIQKSKQEKPEEYDMIVRELGFEMKAQPSEKMKTPEELAREEKEKLQKLESILGDAAHSMDEVIEVKGHAAFPTLDMRFLPELINFLSGTLQLAVQDKTSTGMLTYLTLLFVHPSGLVFRTDLK